MVFEPEKEGRRLRSLINALRRRPFATLSVLALVLTFGVLEDEVSSFIRDLLNMFAKCESSISLTYAKAVIDRHDPDGNSVGLAMAVEKVACEEGVLRELNLGKADLVNFNAHGAKFIDVDFSGANLTRADLSNAEFQSGKFDQANLQHVTAHGANFQLSSFNGTYWDCADFSRATFSDARFVNVSAQSSVMRDVKFYRYGWANVNLGYSDLRGIKLLGYADESSSIFNANVSGMDLSVLTSFFGGRIRQVFGSYGACYEPSDPPHDSARPNWMVSDGAKLEGELLELNLCPSEVQERKACSAQTD